MHIEDRWYRKGPNGEQVPTGRHGTGKRWRVRYTDPDGRERGRSFDRKQAAENFRSTTAADLLRRTYLDPDAGKITLRRYARDWLEG